MAVEIWKKEGPKGKDIAAAIATILTVVFKIFILASVITVFSWTGMSLTSLTFVIITGVGWTLGVGNIVYIYLLFKKKIK